MQSSWKHLCCCIRNSLIMVCNTNSFTDLCYSGKKFAYFVAVSKFWLVVIARFSLIPFSLKNELSHVNCIYMLIEFASGVRNLFSSLEPDRLRAMFREMITTSVPT